MSNKFIDFPANAGAFDLLQVLEKELKPDPWDTEEECGRIGVMVTLVHPSSGKKVRFSTGDGGEAGFEILEKECSSTARTSGFEPENVGSTPAAPAISHPKTGS